MADQSKEVRSLLDGRPANIVYDVAEKSVSIRFPNNGQAITQSDIIGVTPIEGKLTHNLVYVKSPENQRESSGEPSFPEIKSVEAEGLLSTFVEEYDIQPQVEHQRQKIPTTHVIVSTLSGTGLAPLFFSSVLKPFLSILNLREHADYAVHQTTSATTVTELTENTFLPQANEGIAQRIILLSGDGGIVDVVNGLMSEKHAPTYKAPRIILIPMGTGNALAHSSGITRDNTWGLSTLARGSANQLPLLKSIFSPGARLISDEGNKEEEIKSIDGSPVLFGAVVCSWGLHAALVADSDTSEYRKFGIERFKMAAAENLFPSDGSTSHAYRAKVSLLRRNADGNKKWTAVQRDDHSYVLAALVSNLEKTFVINPKSEPLDGHLRVVHFGHMNGQEVMRIMGLAYQAGKHVEDKDVGYEDVEGLSIDFNGTEKHGRWRRICVDGKIVRVEENGWIKVTKEPSNVLELNVLK